MKETQTTNMIIDKKKKCNNKKHGTELRKKI